MIRLGMSKKCFVFPGQGSQYVNMGAKLIENHQIAKEMFDQAESILNMPLTQYISVDGPELKRTNVVQPAIYTISCAIAKIMMEYGIEPDYVAGHSLGEYAAMYTSGLLSFEQGLNILIARGKAMQSACEKEDGGMIACLMTDSSDENFTKCEELAKAAADESEKLGSRLVCQVANYNTNDQIVISGHKQALEIAKTLAEANPEKYGVKRAVPLAVAGAYHSELMRGAADELEQYLKASDIKIGEQKIPIIWNVVGHSMPDETVSKEFNDLLTMQMHSKVLWYPSIKFAIEQGVDRFYELGPGAVLGKMISRLGLVAESIECPLF